MIGEVAQLAGVALAGAVISRWGVRTVADVAVVVLTAAVLGTVAMLASMWAAEIYMPLAVIVLLARLWHFDRAEFRRAAHRLGGDTR